MAAYQTFTVARTTEPDPALLLSQLRALDSTAGVQHEIGTSTFVLKKATAWLTGQISAAQNVLETAPVRTPETVAQSAVDNLPTEMKAVILTLIDQLNVIRAALPTPLGAITPAQALAAVRAKAGTL